MDDIIVRTSTEQIVRFMDAGRGGLAACSHIPVRNFRLFVAVKLPGDSPEVPRPEQFADCNRTKLLQDIRRQLARDPPPPCSPRPLRPEALLEGAAAVQPLPGRLPEQNFSAYDQILPLRKQIFNADTRIRDHGDHLQVGGTTSAAPRPRPSRPRSTCCRPTHSLAASGA